MQRKDRNVKVNEKLVEKRIILRQQTFFQLNRWYLLLMPFAALLIPLGEFEWERAAAAGPVSYMLPVWTEWQTIDYTVQATLAQPTPGFSFRLYHTESGGEYGCIFGKD